MTVFDLIDQMAATTQTTRAKALEIAGASGGTPHRFGGNDRAETSLKDLTTIALDLRSSLEAVERTITNVQTWARS